MFAVDVCDVPATGDSTFVVLAGLFVLGAGVIVTRWVRASAGRLSVVVAPLVLLGGLVLAPQVADPCAPTTTTVARTTVAPATTTVAPATTTVAPATTTVAPVVYSVGSTGPSGGTIFYVDLTRAVDSQYFEVACAGWQNGCDGTTVDPGIEWGCYGTPISGADGTAIGTGEQNTTDILAGCPDAGIAAEVADAYSNAGQTDWFLPSQDELKALCKWAFNDTVNAVCNDDGYDSLSLTNGAFWDDGYWSSSGYTGNAAWFQYFDAGVQYLSSKSGTSYVRLVRAF